MGTGPPTYWDSEEERDRILADRIEAELARPAPDMWRRQRQAARIREMVAAAMNGQQAWHEWLVKDGGRGVSQWPGRLFTLLVWGSLAVSVGQLIDGAWR